MHAITRMIGALGLPMAVAFGVAASPAPAKPAPKQRTPKQACQADCRKARRTCVKAGKHGRECLKANKACYKDCRTKFGAKR